MKLRIEIAGIFCVFYSLSQVVVAQDTSTPWKTYGTMGLYGDFYSMVSDSAGAIAPRRPGSMGRTIGNVTFSKNDFSVTTSWLISPIRNSVILPEQGNTGFMDFIRNPSNRICISPAYKWARLILGTQVPVYSELSVGDLPVFGAGIALRPGRFRFSAFTGTTQLAIKEDTTRFIQGIYARNISSAKIGFGDEDSSHIYVIASVMNDDTTSLSTKPLYTMPQRGVLTSLDYRIKLAKQFYIKGEIAGSAFTRDTRSSVVDLVGSPVPEGIFKTQASSRFDYASVLSFYKEGRFFSLKLSGKYIGDGFVPLGYPFMQTDRLDLTLDPRFNLFKEKVQLSASVGKRINNLSEARGATTSQLLASANLTWQCTERLSISSSFSNFDFRNTVSNDTLKVEMVTLAWSIGPTYMYTTEINMHVFSATYSQNNFRDFNTISGALNDNDSRNAIVSYVLSKLNTPLSLSGMYSYFDNYASFGSLVTNSFNIGASYRFLKYKLNVSTGFTFNVNKLDDGDAGDQWVTNLGLKYKLNKKLDIAMNASVNMYSYGTDRPGISYRENLLRTSLVYKF